MKPMATYDINNDEELMLQELRNGEIVYSPVIYIFDTT